MSGAGREGSEPAMQEREAREDEFNRLYRRYQSLVYKTAYSIVRDRFLAQDVAQEAFMNIFTHLDSITAVANKEAWITAVARNKAIDYCRKKNGRLLLTGQIERWTGAAEIGMDPAVAIDDMLEQLVKLEPRLRQPLLLLYDQDLSYRQIAANQNTTVGVIKTRIHRARKKLRAMVRE